VFDARSGGDPGKTFEQCRIGNNLFGQRRKLAHCTETDD
jgi:hypothetical protein